VILNPFSEFKLIVPISSTLNAFSSSTNEKLKYKEADVDSEKQPTFFS